MKVAFLGNMNNYFFTLVRYLRDKGIDANLLLFNYEQDIFLPSNDSFSLDYMAYTKRLTWGNAFSFFSTPVAEIKSDLKEYDVFVGCGLAPAFFNKVHYKLNVFAPYGSDFCEQVSYRFWWDQMIKRFGNPLYCFSAFLATYHQKRGIMNSEKFHVTFSDEVWEKNWRALRGTTQRWGHFHPLTYAPIYQPREFSKYVYMTHWWQEFVKVRSECDLMVINANRHLWKTINSDINCGHKNYYSANEDPASKGTDRLLNGWAVFLKRNPTVRAKLILFEYGKDVLFSKQLIEQLNISKSVVWFPKMPRKDLMVGLFYADIACGQFTHSMPISGVFHDALVSEKPILSCRNDSFYANIYSELYPIMNACTPDSIANRLEEYLCSPAKFKEMGRIGAKWYQVEVVEKYQAEFLEYLKKKKYDNEAAIVQG